MPYQESWLINVYFLRHSESFYDCYVLLPFPIDDGFEPVFHVTMFTFKRCRQILLWKSEFKWEGMLASGEDGIRARLSRGCLKMR